MREKNRAACKQYCALKTSLLFLLPPFILKELRAGPQSGVCLDLRGWEEEGGLSSSGERPGGRARAAVGCSEPGRGALGTATAGELHAGVGHIFCFLPPRG